MNKIDAMLSQLREYGWTKEEYFGDDGTCCILGAHKNQVQIGNESGYSNLVGAVILEQYPDRLDIAPHLGATTWVYIPEFNDHEDTTFADVELVLEKASLRLEEEVQDV
jgi:hypothetical protein